MATLSWGDNVENSRGTRRLECAGQNAREECVYRESSGDLHEIPMSLKLSADQYKHVWKLPKAEERMTGKKWADNSWSSQRAGTSSHS